MLFSVLRRASGCAGGPSLAWRVRACVRASVRAYVPAYMRAYMRACVGALLACVSAPVSSTWLPPFSAPQCFSLFSFVRRLRACTRVRVRLTYLYVEPWYVRVCSLTHPPNQPPTHVPVQVQPSRHTHPRTYSPPHAPRVQQKQQQQLRRQ